VESSRLKASATVKTCKIKKTTRRSIPIFTISPMKIIITFGNFLTLELAKNLSKGAFSRARSTKNHKQKAITTQVAKKFLLL